MEILQTLVDLAINLGTLVQELFLLAVRGILIIAWIGWWLGAVNWQKAWPFLARGAWAPLLLLAVVSALVWSRISPADCGCLGIVILPNFWWQLIAVSLLVGLALFCGWLQTILNFTPPEISFDPPAVADAGHASHGH